MNSSNASDVSAPPSGDGRRMGLRWRVASAMVLAPVVFAAVHAGPPWVDAFMAAAAMLMAWEWAQLCSRGAGLGRAVLMVAVTCGILLAAAVHAYPAAIAIGGIGAALVFGFTWQRVRADLPPGPAAWHAAAWTAAGVVWIGVPCMAFLWLREGSPEGREIALWLVLVVWATDTAAYVAGRMIGGPRLAPAISPGKTWAGLLGGMVGAAGVGWGAAGWMDAPSPWPLVAQSAALAVVAQAGDLAESYVKRRFGAKDSGRIIPGHGGVLDRLDGFLTAVATAALVILIFGESILPWR